MDGRDRDGLYVAYEALEKIHINGQEIDLDRDNNSDSYSDEEIDWMVGKLFKVLKSEDGTYVTEIELCFPWYSVERATSSALWVYETGTENASDKYTTNGDTLYVMIEDEYNRAGTELTGYDVSVGDFDEIIEDTNWFAADEDGYATMVQVVKETDGEAQLVYIWKFMPSFYTRDVEIYLNDELVDTHDAVPFTQTQINVTDVINAFEEADQTVTAYEYTSFVDGVKVGEFESGEDPYIINIGYGTADVRIDISTAVHAEGNVYALPTGMRNHYEVTVTYPETNAPDRGQPSVDQAIEAIKAYMANDWLNDVVLHDIKMVGNPWNNVYYFEGKDIYDNVHSYTWNSVRDFVPGVKVTVNGDDITVAEDADLAEAFAVAEDTIEGHVVLNGVGMVGYVANDGTGNTSATVVDGGVYTDRNIRLTVGGTDYYGLAETKLADDGITAAVLGLTGSTVMVNGVPTAIADLTYGDLDLGGTYTATAPTISYWKITVDKKAPQYKQNGESVDFTGAKSGFALRDTGNADDLIIVSTRGVTATADAEYTTGYHRLDGSAEAQTALNAFPTATIKWYDANGELPKGASGDSFALNGDYYAVVTIGDGFTAGNVDTLKIAGTNRIVISDSLAGVVSVNGGDAAQVDFTKTAVIEDGTITFYGEVNNADVTVTLTATRT